MPPNRTGYPSTHSHAPHSCVRLACDFSDTYAYKVRISQSLGAMCASGGTSSFSYAPTHSPSLSRVLWHCHSACPRIYHKFKLIFDIITCQRNGALARRADLPARKLLRDLLVSEKYYLLCVHGLLAFDKQKTYATCDVCVCALCAYFVWQIEHIGHSFIRHNIYVFFIIILHTNRIKKMILILIIHHFS